MFTETGEEAGRVKVLDVAVPGEDAQPTNTVGSKTDQGFPEPTCLNCSGPTVRKRDPVLGDYLWCPVCKRGTGTLKPHG